MNGNGIPINSQRLSFLKEYAAIFLHEEGTYNLKGIDFVRNGKTIRVTNEDIWKALDFIFPGRQMDSEVYNGD